MINYKFSLINLINCNTNFIHAVRNVILNYELKKDSIIRKDYVSKALLKFVKEIDYNNYKWIEYDTFKKEEFKILKESNNMNVKVIDNLNESLNNLNIMKAKNLFNENNNDNFLDNKEENILDKEDGSSEIVSESENMNDELEDKNEAIQIGTKKCSRVAIGYPTSPLLTQSMKIYVFIKN